MTSNMHCQKCRTPLKVDGSLEGLNTAAYDVLIGSTSHAQAQKPATGSAFSSLLSPPQNKERKSIYDQTSQHATIPTFKRHGGGGGMRDSTMMSFIYLTESQMGHPASTLDNTEPQEQTKSRRFSYGKATPSSSNPAAPSNDAAEQTDERARLNRLFEILSARSDIDHPICVECSELLVAGLQRRLEDATAERDAYVRFLKEHRADNDHDQVTEEELRAQEESLRRARADEEDARAALVRLEGEKAAVDGELRALEEEARVLDEQEEKFWRDRNTFAAQLQEFQSERDSVNTRFDHDAQLYERLTRTNVHNDTFSISHDGTYGTINGLRLGRLSSVPVDWPEINAAWGHALLLLVTVADKLGYKFVGYEPKPMGSTSRIWRYEQAAPNTRTRNSVAPPPKKTVLELYSSGDVLGLIGMNRSLNAAMIAFLELVRQLGVFVSGQMKARGRPLELPYPIEGDKINDLSIKLSISGEETWTKACKLTLTCCKFLLAHASNMGSTGSEGSPSR